MIAVSIVSHGHGHMLTALVADLLDCPEVKQIIITKNIPEKLEISGDARVEVISNPHPAGFGANHNAAFMRCKQPLFCVLNPDITLSGNPFPVLILSLQADEVGLTAPTVRSPNGSIEDSARYFPSPISVVKRRFFGHDDSYKFNGQPMDFFPEWVAGMFMLFKSSVYSQLDGFDERYFLYYEDVDICIRTWGAGYKVFVAHRAVVIHDARKASWGNMRHLKWHLTSMMRYFVTHLGRLPKVQ